MRDFPKNLKNKTDVYNCLNMVRTGELRAEDLVKAVHIIKNRNFINAGIISVSGGNTIKTRYLAEAEVGGEAVVNGVTVTIESVSHNQGEPDDTGSVGFESTDIVVSGPVDEDATIFALKKEESIYEQMGISEAELDAILAEFEN